MKNLKNIIASIILFAISFVSYTQNQDTLKYVFYLTDNETIDTTFNVENTVTNVNQFSLSKDTLDLGKLNVNMNFSMDSTILKTEGGAIVPIDGAYVTGIFLISEDYDNYDNFNTNLKNLDHELQIGGLGANILYKDNVEDFITTLRDTSKTYAHVVFQIVRPSGNDIYTSFAFDYSVAEDTTTASIATEVIEVSNTRVYPNPVINSLNIEFETINTDTEVEIYSTNGQLMYKDVEYRNFGVNKVSVDMSNYPSGMYIVRLGNEVKKVIKQ